ncbi:MAG: GntR family transcriptional regulator [Burkholderiaceae bacterium]
MSSQIDRVVTALRGRILTGALPAGHRVVEVRFSKELKVSRTPLRLALGELEKEGLLERMPKRGFRVRTFTVGEIAEAVDVRGVLEGMAARLAAERGVAIVLLQQMEDCVALGQRILDAAAGSDGVIDAARWSEMNRRLHALIVQASGNSALAATLEFVSRTPMASAGALTLQGVLPELEWETISRAQADHADCVSAIRAGMGSRAEAIMREHAFRSRENKKTMIARLSKVAASQLGPLAAGSGHQGAQPA